MGAGVGGRLKREGMYVYIQLIHFIVQQKPRQHCNAITVQLKKKGYPVFCFFFTDSKSMAQWLSFSTNEALVFLPNKPGCDPRILLNTVPAP